MLQNLSGLMIIGKLFESAPGKGAGQGNTYHSERSEESPPWLVTQSIVSRNLSSRGDSSPALRCGSE